MTPDPPPRLAPRLPLPPYTYVTGHFPHPTRDRQGHSYQVAPAAQSFDPARWHESETLLHAADLFNHGYYWEAHEAWESLWHACGRTGTAADFLKGLIKLAAAGVKAREGRTGGVRRHASRALELFRHTSAALPLEIKRYLGLSLDEVSAFAAALAGGEIVPVSPSFDEPVQPVWPFKLRVES